MSRSETGGKGPFWEPKTARSSGWSALPISDAKRAMSKYQRRQGRIGVQGQVVEYYEDDYAWDDDLEMAPEELLRNTFTALVSATAEGVLEEYWVALDVLAEEAIAKTLPEKRRHLLWVTTYAGPPVRTELSPEGAVNWVIEQHHWPACSLLEPTPRS